jgi:outer membrane murein-binding lipoprotein Lpp
MFKLFIAALPVAAALLLTGCAAPARIDQMTAYSTPQQRVAQTALRSNVAVRDVTGGKETNPMWVSNVGNSEFEQALEGSLRDVGLLANGKQAGKYMLIAHLDRIDQPMAGLDMTVTVGVVYSLVERASGKEVLNRRISMPYTATFGSAFAGAERLRIANEGAVRANITKLIEELFALNVDKVALN